MIGFLYSHIKDELKSLTNSQGTKVFEKEPKLVMFEAVDEAALARTGWPLALVKFTGLSSRRAPKLEGTEDVYELSDITHTGTGTEEVSLEGSHKGTNSYTLEITTGPNYSLKRRLWDGETWGPEEEISSGSIPPDGKIDVGDGTTFVFANPSGVVVGDTYSWETKAYRRYSQKLREITAKYSVGLYMIEATEDFTGEGHYLDQVISLFSESEIAHGNQVIAQELLSVSLEALTEEERYVAAFNVLFDLSYTGGVYKETTSPLIRELKVAQP